MKDQCVRLPGAIVCGVRPRRLRCSIFGCRRSATAACDYPLENASCDDLLCDEHRIELSRGIDLCPRHGFGMPWPTRTPA